MSAIKWVYKINPEKSLLRGNAYHIAKRVMDLVLVIGTAIFTLPLIAVIALMVKVTSPGGPVFFSQYRTGKGGRRFNMYKLRTMVPNAEELKKELCLFIKTTDQAAARGDKSLFDGEIYVTSPWTLYSQ